MPSPITALLLTLIALLSSSHAIPTTHKRPNALAGVWNLTSITTTYPNGTVVEPLGPKPYGLLVFTPGLYYIQQSNRADYEKDAWPEVLLSFEPGTDAENAGVVRWSTAVSGNYKVDAKGQFAGVTTSGAIIPNLIDVSLGPPIQTVRVQGEKLIERIDVGSQAPNIEYVWERVECF